METSELFSLPSDHWTWVAVRELPFPHSGMGFVGCCGRCGSLTYVPRALYEQAWDDCDRHHREGRDAHFLGDTPADVRKRNAEGPKY